MSIQIHIEIAAEGKKRSRKSSTQYFGAIVALTPDDPKAVNFWKRAKSLKLSRLTIERNGNKKRSFLFLIPAILGIVLDEYPQTNAELSTSDDNDPIDGDTMPRPRPNVPLNSLHDTTAKATQSTEEPIFDEDDVIEDEGTEVVIHKSDDPSNKPVKRVHFSDEVPLQPTTTEAPLLPEVTESDIEEEERLTVNQLPEVTESDIDEEERLPVNQLPEITESDADDDSEVVVTSNTPLPVVSESDVDEDD
jgi:hypothetical protein